MSSQRSVRSVGSFAIFAVLALGTSATRAADTTEPFEPGASDVEMYVGYDGVGLEKEQRVVFGDMLLGYGLQPWLSAYVGATLEGEDAFSDGATTNYLGIYATPLDTSHVDLDVFFDVSSGGTDQVFEMRPALELNLDSDDDMSGVGFYVRAPLPIYGRKFSSPVHPTDEQTEVTFKLETTAGVYATVAPGHQVLVEYNMGFHPDPNEEEKSTEIGGVALGYNVEAVDGLELITQFFADIPENGEDPSFGVMTGFIATVPAGGE